MAGKSEGARAVTQSVFQSLIGGMWTTTCWIDGDSGHQFISMCANSNWDGTGRTQYTLQSLQCRTCKSSFLK
jgi:hypothetical protein